MDNKLLKKIKTSCPFPFWIYKTHITYNEVRNASGIAYILLDLFEKTRDDDEAIANVLLKFGIPRDLHYIFGNEISSLINSDVLTSSYKASSFSNPRYFSEIKMGDVLLTPKGKKMFADGAIPTGQEKEKSPLIYFSPVTRKFDVEYKLPYSDMEKSFLGKDFLENVKFDISGMEDYIQANTDKIGIKKQEKIIEVKYEAPEKKVTRIEEGMTLNICNDGVEFTFNTSDEQAFFNKYYTNDLMTECMGLKNKYKFVNEQGQDIKVQRCTIDRLNNAESVYIPAEMDTVLKQSCSVFLSRNTFGENIKKCIVSRSDELAEELLNKLSDNAEFALLDMYGCKFYEALNVEIPCKNISGSMYLNLLAEYKTDSKQFINLLNILFDNYSNYENDESYDFIIYIVKALNNSEYFYKYIERRFANVKSADEKISLLLKFDNKFNTVNLWEATFVAFGKRLFDESIKEIQIDNMVYKKAVLEPLSLKLKINKLDFISQFSDNIKNENKNIIFEALYTAEFSINEILSVANVIETYIEAVVEDYDINADNELANQFNNIRNNLWKINAMLGIESISNYSIKDDYNVDEFFNTYATLVKLVKNVENYRSYALNGFNKLDRYISIFQPVHELLSLEKTASSNPEKITLKFVDEHIARGKYKEAICDLYIKLQYDLRKLLNENITTKAYELIEEAFNKKLIDKDKLNQLHKMRTIRNYFQHPELKEESFTREDVELWEKIIFSLGGNK